MTTQASILQDATAALESQRADLTAQLLQVDTALAGLEPLVNGGGNGTTQAHRNGNGFRDGVHWTQRPGGRAKLARALRHFHRTRSKAT